MCCSPSVASCRSTRHISCCWLSCLGGMAFLNTWDLPAYLLLVGLAYILPIFEPQQTGVPTLKELIWFGLVLAFCSVFLYLLFYLGFASQAGGILPNLIYPTRGAHFWLMFAPFLIALGGYLGNLLSQGRTGEKLRRGSFLAALILLTLWVLSLLLGYLITLIPQVGDFYLSSLAAQDRATCFRQLCSAAW